jgi:hypothetical protein
MAHVQGMVRSTAARVSPGVAVTGDVVTMAATAAKPFPAALSASPGAAAVDAQTRTAQIALALAIRAHPPHVGVAVDTSRETTTVPSWICAYKTCTGRILFIRMNEWGSV